MKSVDYYRTLPDRDLLLHGKEATTFTDEYVTALIERYEDVLDALDGVERDITRKLFDYE